MNPVYSAHECELSDAQSGIWMAQAIDPSSPAFNIAEYVDIRGPLRPDLFASALRQVVDESDCLRIRISAHVEAVRQSVELFSDWELPVIDFSLQAEPLAAADAWMREETARPLQLNRDPLFLYALLRLGTETKQRIQELRAHSNSIGIHCSCMRCFVSVPSDSSGMCAITIFAWMVLAVR